MYMWSVHYSSPFRHAPPGHAHIQQAGSDKSPGTASPSRFSRRAPRLYRVAVRARLTTLALTLLCAGCLCRVPQSNNPANPFEGVVKVLVPPVWNEAGGPADPREEAQALAGELSQFPGFTAIFPAAAVDEAARLQVDPQTPSEWIPIGRSLRADAALTCVIHEDHRYAPPRFGITLALLRTGDPRSGSTPLWEMTAWGQPGRLANLRDDLRLIGAIQRVRDGGDRTVQRALSSWAARHTRRPDPGWEHLLHVPESYHRFCYNMALRDLCDLAKPNGPSRPR